jgi:hypothetical protein
MVAVVLAVLGPPSLLLSNDIGDDASGHTSQGRGNQAAGKAFAARGDPVPP